MGGVGAGRVGIAVLFALPSYRQGEASIAGKTAEDFALTMDGKPQTSFGLPRESGGAEFLGVVVPTLRGRGAVAEPLAAAHSRRRAERFWASASTRIRRLTKNF